LLERGVSVSYAMHCDWAGGPSHTLFYVNWTGKVPTILVNRLDLLPRFCAERPKTHNIATSVIWRAEIVNVSRLEKSRPGCQQSQGIGCGGLLVGVGSGCGGVPTGSRPGSGRTPVGDGPNSGGVPGGVAPGNGGVSVELATCRKPSIVSTAIATKPNILHIIGFPLLYRILLAKGPCQSLVISPHLAAPYRLSVVR
jgi:hypothetical protein